MMADTAASTGDTALQELLPGLYATPTAPLPFLDEVVVRSFVLLADQGPVIIYNSPGIDAATDEITDLGHPTRLLINHYHEAMYGSPALELPVHVHEQDRAGVQRSMHVSGVFTEREFIGADLEAIPSGSHTPGTTFFLWRHGDHRFLFPGDAIWVDEGLWKAVILKESGTIRARQWAYNSVRTISADSIGPVRQPPGFTQVSCQVGAFK